MRGITPEVARCMAPTNPPPTVRLRVLISGQGRVTLLETIPSPPPAVSACVAQALETVQLRATGLDPIRVLYPITLRE
jgi:hypothetical protein